MFCGNCGANNPEGSSVCGSCGAALTPEESSGGSIMDKVSGNKKLIGIIAAAVAAVAVIAVAVVIIVMIMGGKGPKGVAKKYIEASLKENGGKDLVALIPSAYKDDLIEAAENLEKEADLVQEVNDYLEDRQENYSDCFGDKAKVKVEVRKVKDWKNSDIKDLQKSLDEAKMDVEIQEGADVDLKITVEGDEKETFKPTVSVVKIDGKWYVNNWYSVNSQLESLKSIKELNEANQKSYEESKKLAKENGWDFNEEAPKPLKIELDQDAFRVYVWREAYDYADWNA